MRLCALIKRAPCRALLQLSCCVLVLLELEADDDNMEDSILNFLVVIISLRVVIISLRVFVDRLALILFIGD